MNREQREKLERAVSAVTKFLMIEDSLRDGACPAVWHRLRKEQKECIWVMSECSHPAAQSAVGLLMLDMHSTNCREEIAELLEAGAPA